MSQFRKVMLVLLSLLPATPLRAQEADLILTDCKIACVDAAFSIQQALAVAGGRILAVGANQEVLKLKGPGTRVVNLGGKFVLPGLIDSHVHPSGASMTEFDHPIPDMESVEDVLKYIKSRATVVPAGAWIQVSQVFITRLREQRYPTRAELDEAAPGHPVIFATGPDASLNSLALKRSGIDKNFKVTDGGAGFAEKNPETGEPTGLLRNCTRYVRTESSDRDTASEADRLARLALLFKDYNSVGLTGVIDRDASPSALDRYQKLNEAAKLTIRVAASHSLGTGGSTESIQKSIRAIAQHPLRRQRNAMVGIIGIKTFLDGGMLTGSAFMRQPWGLSKIYSITDPSYRGLQFIPVEKLTPIVQTAVENGLQFTAHSVGDGAVHTLLETYDAVNKKLPIQSTRPCVTHSNFMSAEAIAMAQRLGVVLDIQPAWLYLDTRTLTAQFGYERLRYFQPLRSIFSAGVIAGGGSDHMQKIGSLRSINPYNPFLGMWVTITRKAKQYDGQLHPEEALSREQAIRFYTMNNAHLMFLEKEVGSLEKGKLADFIVLDRDLLTCPVDDIKDATCLQTYLAGKLVYEKR